MDSANAICSGTFPATVFTTRGSVGSKSGLPFRKVESNATVTGGNGPSVVEGMGGWAATSMKARAKRETQSAMAPAGLTLTAVQCMAVSAIAQGECNCTSNPELHDGLAATQSCSRDPYSWPHPGIRSSMVRRHMRGRSGAPAPERDHRQSSNEECVADTRGRHSGSVRRWVCRRHSCVNIGQVSSLKVDSL